jgi:hypothetical protein
MPTSAQALLTPLRSAQDGVLACQPVETVTDGLEVSAHPLTLRRSTKGRTGTVIPSREDQRGAKRPARRPEIRLWRKMKLWRSSDTPSRVRDCFELVSFDGSGVGAEEMNAKPPSPGSGSASARSMSSPVALVDCRLECVDPPIGAQRIGIGPPGDRLAVGVSALDQLAREPVGPRHCAIALGELLEAARVELQDGFLDGLLARQHQCGFYPRRRKPEARWVGRLPTAAQLRFRYRGALLGGAANAQPTGRGAGGVTRRVSRPH